MMECPVQCGRNAHAAPGFFLWQELPLKHPKRMRSSMPQAAFYGDWGASPTSRAFVSRKPCLQKSKVHKILSTRNRLRLDFPRGLEYNYCDYLWKLLELDRRIVWAIYQSDRQRKNGIFRQDGSVIFATPDEFPEQ